MIKYTESMPENLVKLRREGYSIVRVCNEWDIGRQTYYDWLHAHSEFKKVQDRADTAYQAWIEDLALQGMWAGKEFNAHVFRIFAAHQAKWSEKSVDACHELGEITEKNLKKLLSDGKISASVYKTIEEGLTQAFTRENGEKVIAAEIKMTEMVKAQESE